MAFSKAHKFSDEIYHFSLMCKALSHPARVMIIKTLISLHGERALASKLISNLAISKQAASVHLKMLREMSVISCEEEYPHVYYRLNSELINTYFGLFSLVTQAELKVDETFSREIPAVGGRRTLGTAPV